MKKLFKIFIILFVLFLSKSSYSQMLEYNLDNLLSMLVDSSRTTNDYQCYLTWAESYAIRSFLEVYRRKDSYGGNTAYLDSAIIRMNNVLNNRDDKRGVVTYDPAYYTDHEEYVPPAYRGNLASWRTLRNHKELSYAFIVSDALTCYPFLVFADIILVENPHSVKNNICPINIVHSNNNYSEVAEYFYNRAKETIDDHEFKWQEDFTWGDGTSYEYPNTYIEFDRDYLNPVYRPYPIFPNHLGAWGSVIALATKISKATGLNGNIYKYNYKFIKVKTSTLSNRLRELADYMSTILEYDPNRQVYTWYYDYEPHHSTWYYEDFAHGRLEIEFISLIYNSPDLLNYYYPFNFKHIWGISNIVATNLIKSKGFSSSSKTWPNMWDLWDLINGTDDPYNVRTTIPRHIASWCHLALYDYDIFSIAKNIYDEHYLDSEYNYSELHPRAVFGYCLVMKYLPGHNTETIISSYQYNINNSSIYASKKNVYSDGLQGGTYDYKLPQGYKITATTSYDWKNFYSRNDELIIGICDEAETLGKIFVIENSENSYNPISRELSSLEPSYKGMIAKSFTNGDFDNDGDLELATAFYHPGNHNSIIYLTEDSNPHRSISQGTYDYILYDKKVSAIIAGDFDVDGYIELIVAADYYSSKNSIAYYIDNPLENSSNSIRDINNVPNANVIWGPNSILRITSFAYDSLNNELITSYFREQISKSFLYLSQNPSTTLTCGTYDYEIDNYIISALTVADTDKDNWSELIIGLTSVSNNNSGKAYSIEDAENLYDNHKDLNEISYYNNNGRQAEFLYEGMAVTTLTTGHYYTFDEDRSSVLKGTDPNMLKYNTIDKFYLEQNYPNPFNISTKITFNLEKEGYISLIVYDVLGRKVRTLFSEYAGKGHHQVTWDGTTESGIILNSGIYYYTLSHSEKYITRKMLLIK